MLHVKIINPLHIFIEAAIKRRKYKGILQAADIRNDLYIEFVDTDYTSKALDDQNRITPVIKRLSTWKWS